MPAQCAAEREAPTGQLQMRDRQARGKSPSHTSEFCPRLPRADKNRADWYSSRAAHVGNYRQFRQCPGADKKTRARPDKVAAQIATPGTRLRPVRIQRRGRPSRLRRSRQWDDVSNQHESYQDDALQDESVTASHETLHDSFSEDSDLLANS